MEKILITGASGFIGTNLLDSLKNKGYESLNVDIACPRNKAHIPFWKEIDITNYEQLLACVSEFSPDYILHLAARTDLEGISLSDYDANTIGVENILKIAKQLKGLKKMIITSSMLVCKGGYTPRNQFDYCPVNSYGKSKVETERIVWENKLDCDWAIVRPTSIWGPYFGVPYKDFFDRVLSRRFFHIGHKSNTKTYGYVENAVYQIEQILFSDTVNEYNKIFYLGDIPAVSVEEWANEIATEVKIKILRVPFFLFKFAAVIGDSLKMIGINFPMTSFRLKNMTTDNIVNLENTFRIAPNPPFSRVEGVKKTIEWINSLTCK